MGLLDKVKAQAAAATEAAKDAAAKGQAKMTRRRPRRRPTACCGSRCRLLRDEDGAGHARHRGRRRAPGGGAAGARVRARPDHTGARVRRGRPDGGTGRRRWRPRRPRRPRKQPTRRRPRPRPRRRRRSRAHRHRRFAEAAQPRSAAPWSTPRSGVYTAFFAAGWSSLVARRAHNPKVGGSNPPPATQKSAVQSRSDGPALLLPDQGIPATRVPTSDARCEIPVHA